MQFKANFFLGLLSNLIPIIAVVILWSVVYQNKASIAGFSKAQLVSYYLLIYFTRTLLNILDPRLICHEFYIGTFSNNLIRPINYFLFQFFQSLGSQTGKLIIMLLSIIVIYVTGSQNILFPISPLAFVSFLLSLVLSAALIYTFNFALGSVSFYVSDAANLPNAADIVVDLFSGVFFPIVFLPHLLQNAAKLLPFAYFYSFPIDLYLGKLTVQAGITGFLVMLVHLLISGLICRVLWKKGLDRYIAVGG